MNKILTKVTALCVGLAMVAGVGVAVGSKSVGEAKADTVNLTFSLTSNPGGWPTANSTTETEYNYTLNNVTYSFALKNVKCNSGYLMCTQVAALGLPTLSNGKLTKIVASNSSGCSTSTRVGVSSSGSSASYISGGAYQTWSTTSSSYTYNLSGTSDNTRYYLYVTNKNAQITSLTLTYETTSQDDHTVTDSVSDGTISPSSVADGGTLTATITPDTWYSVPTSVSVTMGGTAVAHTYSNGVVTVQNVTGDIEISGSCVKTGGPAHAGTLADPYTIADAYMAIDDNAGTDNVYVQGIVSGIVESWSTQHSNISFNISSDGTTTANQLEAFRCVSSTEHPISSDSDIETGATVVVLGSLTKYNSTYEFSAGCKVVSYTAPTSSPLSSISLSGTHATSFDVGDTFSYAGLVVTAHYEDSSSKTVTPTSVSTPDMSSAGQKTVIVSYTENEVSKSAEYTITVNAVTYYEISFLPGEGSGTHASVQAKEGSDYELPTSTTFTAPEGKVFDYWDLGGSKVTVIENIDDDYEVTAIWKDAPSEVSDTLTAELIGVTSYGDWSDISATSSAVYAGNSTKSSHDAIQMRSNNSNSGIVSTTSGGTIAKVIVEWNTTDAPTTARTLDIYAKASAYSAATDLYNSSTQGTKVGSLSYTDTTTNETTLEIADEYAYVGVRSNSGALYIDSITFVWSGSAPTPKVLESISVSNQKTAYEVNDSFVKPTVTAYYDDESDKDVSSKAEFSGYDLTVAGEYTVVVSYTENEVEKTTSYGIVVSEPVPVETKTYKKVKTNLANFAGDYLIVYEEGSVAFDGSLENPDVASNTFGVSITDEAISASEAYEFTVAKKEGGYSLKSAYGLYIGKTANSNGMDKNANDNYINTISYLGTEESDMDIVGSGLPHLRYNASSGQERFRFFKSDSYTGQKAVSLYIEVANDAEAFALDILNLTTEVCSAEGEHASGDFATAWSTLTTKYNSVVNKDLLVEGEADATGTFFAEALARYDILVAKYNLNNFMTGRVSNLSYLPHYESNLDSSSSITIIVIVAVASMTLLGVTLVIRKRKHQ